MLHAFFVGRALAEAINERAERLLTDTISTVGKFDAEQREHLRQFTEDVLGRARQAEEEAGAATASSGAAAGGAGFGAQGSSSQDLQATIDTLRAEIAQVRVALQQYRATSQASS
jgi:polyhydroxyalkanoate synthesis regulator phasin